jgi:hypothetical protein
MQCTTQMQTTLMQAQLNGVKMWTMEELCRLGDKAEKQKEDQKVGCEEKAVVVIHSSNSLYDPALAL